MSERMSTKAAEDMLTSIRRLVADEIRPEAEVTQQPARLLLTAALRVDPSMAPISTVERVRPLRAVLLERRTEQSAEVAPLILTEDLAVTPERVIAERPAPEPLRLVPNTAPPAAEDRLPAEEPEPEATELAARLAELEELLDAHQGYEVEEHALDDTTAWIAHQAQVSEGRPFIDLGWASDAPPAPEPLRVEPAPIAEDPAAEMLISNSEELYLRRVIQQVLREELEGPMGERVTRNLRKIIRTEIARAFTARGFS